MKHKNNTYNVNKVKTSSVSTKKDVNNNVYSVNDIIKNVKSVEKEVKSYQKIPMQVNTTESVRATLDFIHAKYHGNAWALVAGELNTKAIKYVKENAKQAAKVLTNEKGVYLKDSITKYSIDLPHMAVTIESNFCGGLATHVPFAGNDVKEFSGWAGDLSTAIADVQINSKNSKDGNLVEKVAKNIIGNTKNNTKSSFPISDVLADVDAVNISNLMHDKGIPFSKAMNEYYNKGGVKNRYTSFINSFGGKSDFEDEVKSDIGSLSMMAKKLINQEKQDVRNHNSKENVYIGKEPNKAQITQTEKAFINYIEQGVEEEKKAKK